MAAIGQKNEFSDENIPVHAHTHCKKRLGKINNLLYSAPSLRNSGSAGCTQEYLIT
jgi:hypothetical protein